MSKNDPAHSNFMNKFSSKNQRVCTLLLQTHSLQNVLIFQVMAAVTLLLNKAGSVLSQKSLPAPPILTGRAAAFLRLPIMFFSACLPSPRRRSQQRSRRGLRPFIDTLIFPSYFLTLKLPLYETKPYLQ